MQPVPQQRGRYREANYHDLVDKPFFVGRFDYDSTQVAGDWTRLATYPAGALAGPRANGVWDDIAKMIPAEVGGVPGDAVDALHGDDDLRLLARRRQRAGAHQLARRHLQPGIHRQPDPGLDHRARDLPRLEREAAPAGGHGAVSLRPAGADRLALGERGHHRLLRRPRHPARRDHRRRRSSSTSPRGRSARWRAIRRPRSRTPRSRPGSTRPTAAGTSTTRRARSPASCSTS